MKYSLFASIHFITIYAVLNSIRWLFPSILPTCCACHVALCLLLSILTFGFTKKKYLSDLMDPHNKAIFITGCDTGFGHNLAKRMDSKGYHVFAGCLFPDGQDASRLRESCSQRLKVVDLDVTKDESVEKAVEFVRENLNTCDFWAVVNNAGILKGFSVEGTDMKEFRETMEVNAFGPVRVTKAFLPLLKQSKGRVVTVTSLAGRVTAPYSTPYFMSKHAAVAFSDSLRQELDEYGIRVISIEPEMFQTNLTTTIRGKMDSAPDSSKSCRKDGKEDPFRSITRLIKCFIYFESPKIELVVNDLEQAISSKYPDLIYKPRRSILFRYLIQAFEIMPLSFQDLLFKLYSYLTKLFY